MLESLGMLRWMLHSGVHGFLVMYWNASSGKEMPMSVGRYQKAIHFAGIVLAAIAITGSYGCQECNPCNENESLETTEYIANSATIVNVTIPPDGQLYCHTRYGWLKTTSRTVTYSGSVGREVKLPNFLDGPDGGPYNVYYNDFVEDTGEARWDMWLGCGAMSSSAKLYNVVLNDADLSPDPERYRMRRAFEASQKLSTTVKLSKKEYVGGHLGTCVQNVGALAFDVKYQFYLPTLECRVDASSQPAPLSGGEPLNCIPNDLPVPPSTPPVSRTCADTESLPHARYWYIPISSPLTGCGAILPFYANSVEEARSCARLRSFATPPLVCEFEVLLHTGPDYYVYPVADSEESALSCSRAIGSCSTCSPVVLSVGTCVRPF